MASLNRPRSRNGESYERGHKDKVTPKYIGHIRANFNQNHLINVCVTDIQTCKVTHTSQLIFIIVRILVLTTN